MVPDLPKGSVATKKLVSRNSSWIALWNS